MDQDLYLGLISGTSVDGVDAVLVSFSESRPKLIASSLFPYDAELRDDVLSLFTPGDCEIDRMGVVDHAVGELFARAAKEVLDMAGVPAAAVRAIGCHGQTIRHRPHAIHPFTLQIGNPYVLAERTGIDVVWDFRRRDMVLGGQGAPLAPLFHRAFMSDQLETRVVLNLGGIANITRLPADGSAPVAFDTGPANGLMDAWIHQTRRLSFDSNGAWASSAQPDQSLLAALLSEPYFQLPAPKSTGKELFHLPWAEKHGDLSYFDPAIVQATFLALTVESVAQAIETSGGCDRVLVCGGGVHNTALLQKLERRLGIPLALTANVGVEPDWLEAMAFAWMARCHLAGVALDTPPFTGARAASVLGSLVPARAS